MCTAIMVSSTMLLSVHLRHSGHDEVDYLEALEVVRDTLTKGKRAGAADFFIGGALGSISIGMGCTDLSAKVALRTLLLTRKN